MAELLAQWLNDEVSLSQKVTDFEKDFANGYLFGELLYKYNQQQDFAAFSRKEVVAHKMGNFEKLEPTLRNLKIKFDSQQVDRIMKEERGVALRLLYQLKMMLEKVYTPTDVQVLKATGQFADGQPIQKIPAAKEKFDAVQHAFFKQRLQTLNKPQKTLNMEKHLAKFEHERTQQESVAKRANHLEKKQKAENKQELRRVQLNKLQRNAGFMEEWHQKGVENWKKNMTVKREREANQLEFDYKQAEKFNAIALDKLDAAGREVNDGIDQFESTLRSQGINTRVQKDDAQRAVSETLKNFNTEKSPMKTKASEMAMSLTRMDPSKTTKNGAFTLASTGLKHKTKTTVDERTRKAREKRRCRLVTQQYSIMESLDQQQREARVLDLTQRKSNQEKELDYEVWRTNQCKNLIVENRKLREKQYERRRDLDVQNGIVKEETLLRSLQEQTNRSIAEMERRDGEMRVYQDQQRTKGRTSLCAGLMDAIFDIADEAYNHKQNLDSVANDERNWREWLQLFKEDQPIANTHNNLSTSVTEETGGEGLEAAEAAHDPANKKLDDLELVDYLTNKGQWPVELVTANKQLIEQLISAPVENAPTGKGGKNPKAAAAADNVVLEKDDLELEDKAPNNFLLGDCLEQIIKLNNDARARLKHPQTPNWLALKLCLVGYPFAGKDTSAKFIKEKYGLDVFVMETLIEEARATATITYDENVEEFKQDDRGSRHASDVDSMSSDEEGEIDAKNEFRQLGIQINDLLYTGQEISDEIYVHLFVTKLRLTYEYKSPQQKLREKKAEARRSVEVKERLAVIEAALCTGEGEQLKKKQRKEFEAEQAELQKELDNLMRQKHDGWVLVDFPCTYAQSKLLEQALSGYQPDVELEPIQRDIELQEAHLLVQPTATEEPPQELISSGLDAVLWFECDIKECLRRADGRYIDNADADRFMFHVEDVPPPVDQAPLCERLNQQIRENNSISTLMDRFVAFDQQNRSMTRWLRKFGVQDKDRSLLKVITANQSQADVQAEIAAHISLVLQHKQEKNDSVRETHEFKIKHMLEQQKRVEEEDAQRRAEVAADQSQRSSVKSPRLDESAQDVQKSSQPAIQVAPGSKSGNVAGGEKSQRSMIRDGSTSQFGGGSHTEAVIPPGRSNIEDAFQPTILRVWKEMSASYKSQMSRVLRNVRIHREQFMLKFSQKQQSYLTFLHRLDQKQEILHNFVREFNEFSDEYPDLREDDQTKEELHQRTDVLSDELWEIVEDRKEQNVEERRKIMESGGVEFSLNFLTNCAKQLMQAELDKFKISVQLLQDYYHAIEDKILPDSPQANISELAFAENEEPPPIEQKAEGSDENLVESWSFPRLDKLLIMALKQQIVPDVTQMQAVIDPKKGAKKDVKKGATKVEEDSQAVEESVYVKEMREAVKTEKAILRFRLVQIRNWALENLRQNKKAAIDLYKKLDDWIFVAQKAEMDSIEEMCIVIKEAIETEEKIQNELCIQFMDFTVNEKIMNFITPPPPKLEAMEDRRDYRFTVPQLQALYEEFHRIETFNGGEHPEFFTVQLLAQTLMNKINYSRNFGGYLNALPKHFQSIDLQAIMGMTRNIDNGNTGLVNWRQFLTYLTLGNSPLPTVNKLNEAKASAGGRDAVTKSQFVGANFWFDEHETSQDRAYSEPFDRASMIKEILFDINARPQQEGEPLLHFDSLVEILRIPYARNNQAKIFSDFLFSPVKAIAI